MKQNYSYSIVRKVGKSYRPLIKKEWALFAKNQFEMLMKKNLRIPVSIFHL
ncbi:MAG TPA: hypothetical protein VJB63_00205 [Patescibacteria group bacterium]|nr:hypothetical protein [Patescibacteria group bacterium]